MDRNSFYNNYVFDLYGTLVDIHTDETLPELWKNASDYFYEKGMHILPNQFHERYTRLCQTSQKKLERILVSKNIPGPAEIDLTEIWDGIAQESGGKLTLEENAEFSRLFRERSTRKLKLFPGAAELLQKLHGNGKNVILLTNAQACFTLPELDKLGIRPFFDRILISSNHGVKKPSPAFFSKLFDNGESPSSFLMIGNDDICDCHGSAAVGIDSLYIFTEQSPKRRKPLPERCREIFSLYDVLEV